MADRHLPLRRASDVTTKRSPQDTSVGVALQPPSPTDSFGSGPLRPLPPLPCSQSKNDLSF